MKTRRNLILLSGVSLCAITALTLWPEPGSPSLPTGQPAGPYPPHSAVRRQRARPDAAATAAPRRKNRDGLRGLGTRAAAGARPREDRGLRRLDRALERGNARRTRGDDG